MKKSQQGKPSLPDESQSHTRSVKDGQSTRIVGFDPGLNITGYGVIEVLPNQQVQLVEAGTIRPKSKDDIQDRLHVIHSGVREILETFAPQSMAIEQLFVHVRFPKTAILMGHARGVICLAAAQAGIELHHYLPNRVKSMLTGSGHAGKEQMQLAVQRELRLKTRPEPADAADALAIALADFYLRLRALPGTQAQFRDNT
ncbi:crossover junction endodeoxyribonuclease RuvC [Pirellulales bacterium]|nr:crossover junction endodeoxyribonuclease RuvC [Pirellulales bacterium]